MNKIVTLFFVVLMLQGNSGYIMPNISLNWTSGHELLRIYQTNCTEQHDHSFIAIIVEDEWLKNIRTLSHACTGSIIDMKWVLVSSSCIQTFFDWFMSSGSKKLAILANFNEALNTYDFRLMKQFFSFKKIMTSVLMTPDVLRDDIGLIELEQPFQQRPTRSIRIARKGEAAHCKKANYVTTFCDTKAVPGSSYKPNISSRCRGVSFVQRESCSFNRSSVLDAEMLCMREERKWLKYFTTCSEDDTCNDKCFPVRGRSLFCKDSLIGIEVGCLSKYESSYGFIFFLKIEPYLDFIESTLRNSSISGKEDKKKKKKQKKTTAKTASSRAGFLKGAVKKTNLLLITSTLFIYL